MFSKFRPTNLLASGSRSESTTMSRQLVPAASFADVLNEMAQENG